MKDLCIESRRVEYNHYPKGSKAPRDEVVRVFRHSPERVQLQLRNNNHYMTATLDLSQVVAVINALQAGADELLPPLSKGDLLKTVAE